MKGFKSFAHKTDLIFDNGFNCIIGPNGSGKTNVSDSICFVLGKSSAHDMRAEKSASLIFNGGKKGSAAKEAEVSLIFDNSSKKFPIDKKEIKITRIVRKNGTSIYKINDETRTRQQILELLRGARIDPNGHNIVLQGDIVSLAEMKPNDRRKVIEEISGISMYEEKKQKCLNELERVGGRLNEAEIILTEREVNLRELKKERDQAIKYKDLQQELKDKKGTFLHLQIKDKEIKLEDIEKRKRDIQNKVEKINKEIEELKNKIQENKTNIENINKEVDVKGEKEQIVLRKELEDLKTTIVKSNSRLEVCQTEIEKIKQRKSQLNDNIKEVESKIKQLKSQKNKHDEEIKEINNQENKLNKKIIDFKEKHGVDTDFSSSLEQFDKEIDDFLLEISKIKEEEQNIIRNKDQVRFKLDSIDERLESLKGSKELEELKNNKKIIKEITNNLNKTLNEDSSFSSQLINSRKQITNNSEELSKLKSRQIGIQERSLANLATRKILDLKNNIKGIHGTVSSLGNVESKYSLALEIAAGARMNSIVVDSDTTAKKCIEYLKNNKLGVATFLPSNKIKSRVLQPGIKEILNKKGVQGLALDLVKYDKKFKNIFSYTLGSTIIIDNIETARKIGIGRARMVTLEGDLMEPSGAMIGGYRKKRIGLGFKEKEIDENILKLETELKKLRNLVNHVESKKSENELKIQELREQKANTEADIIKLEKTLNIESDTSDLISSRKDLIEQEKNYEKEINNFNSKIKEVNKSLELTKSKKQKIKEKLADPTLSKNLELLEEERLKIREKSLEIQGNIKNITTQIESMLLPEKEKTDKIIKQQEKELEDFQKELSSIKEIINNREKELKAKEKEEKKFHTNVRDLITKRNKIEEKIKSLEANIIREDEKRKNNEQRLNNINIDRAKFVAEVEALQREFEPFQDAKIKRGMSVEELRIKIKEDERELNKIGNVNLRALEVYDQINVEYEKILQKVNKLKEEKEDVLNMMNEIESKKKDIFMKTYKTVMKRFKAIFEELTTKGQAHVILEDEENPFEAGIDIQVRVAGNKFLDMRSLSGGEKTMAALAFIFAIQEHDPSPFYLLDEVDAALDKRNSELLSKLIQKYAEKAQYLVISHNDSVITEAVSLYGVSMQDSISKVVSLKV